MDSPITIDTEIPERRNSGATGPRTPQGKAISSMNRLAHGCRSQKTVLRHEKIEEFDALIAGWFAAYDPQDSTALTLLQETARAHWFLKRAQTRLEEVEFELPMSAHQWTQENHRSFSIFTRYKNNAERTFFRFFRELESHLNRLDRQEQSRQRALDRAAAIEARAGRVKTAAAAKKPVETTQSPELAEKSQPFDAPATLAPSSPTPDPVDILPPRL